MPFFPDYSDHGALHFQRVLDLCDFLVADYDPPRQSSWKALTSNDAAVLIQSVLLHDVGMHLDPEGFRLLVTESSGGGRLAGSGLHWPHEWESYLSEASRWDDRGALQVYGSLLEEYADRPRFRRPPFDADKHDKMDRLLIGEFLRRHHAAIALDVAVSNLPAGIGLPDMALRGLLAEISGVIAKSHGEPVRKAVRQAESRFDDARFTSHVHITYLMALLRIADYLHPTRSGRNPIRMISPRSRVPFLGESCARTKRSKKFIFDRDPDKEAVYVEITSDPQRLDRVSTLLNIRENWLEGLASELNQAWGEIGRAYSRYPTMGDLGLAVRRVNTNASSSALESRLPFYPKHADFRAADSGFLKLLVEPLYGDRPEIGIRELMQNAIDAVRERRDNDQHRGSGNQQWPQLCDLDPNADVVVSLCARRDDTPTEEAGGPPRYWERWVEVQDRGIGMTHETVVKNLLIAGASYRDTMPWKQQHKDDEGNSRVLRSGRFGVGALAAFLLGPEIEIITRHASANEGVRFAARMADENIDLRRCEASVGTTVRVEASCHTIESIFESGWTRHWDWYHLAWPKVLRRKQSDEGSWLSLDEEDEYGFNKPVILPGPCDPVLPVG